MAQSNLASKTTPGFGKYRLLAQIGKGGMAEAFIANAAGPAGFNKLFVVKRMLATLSEDASYRAMFLQEARLAARLNHPNVVQTYEVGEEDGVIYMAMEYLEGQPLHRVRRALAKDGRNLSQWTWARAAAEILAGLHYAHELRDFDGAPLRVVHRDVSPQNIFVTYEGQVKVLDFGIAKAERGAGKTQAGVVKGKYSYMAPEQFADAEIDRRVDVFTTGIVLWELIAGRSLFGGGGEAQVLNRVLNEPIPRLSSVVPDVDPRLDELVAKALERDRERRFASALEMRAALEVLLSISGARTEDLGQVVSTTFAEARTTIQVVLTKALGGHATLAEPLIEDDFISIGSIRTVSGTRAVMETLPETGGPVAATAAVPAQGRAKRPALAALGVAAIAACALAAGLAFRRPAETPAQPVVATVAAPPPVAAVAPPSETHEVAPAASEHHTKPASSPTQAARPAPPPPPVYRPVIVVAPTPPPKAAPPPAVVVSAPSPAAAPPTPAETAAPTPSKPPEGGRRFRTTF